MRACNITKEWSRFLREYGYPEDYEEMTEEELKQMTQTVISELAEEDSNYLPKLRQFTGFTGGDNTESNTATTDSNGNVVTRTETELEQKEKTTTQQLAHEMEVLRANVPATLAKYQAVTVSTKLVRTAALAKQGADHDLVKPFVAQLDQHVERTERCVNLLDAMLTNETTDEELPTLLQLIKEVDADVQYSEKWAARFDLEIPGQKKPKRTKASGSGSSGAAAKKGKRA